MGEEAGAMRKRDLLIRRLDQIAGSLAAHGGALALLGLGSAGLDLERMDEFSDLDFFVIVRPGSKAEFLDDLGWLAAGAPIAYAYRNTPDGHKALFADGVFCEFAVFESDELKAIPFAPGRLIWKAPGFDESACTPPARSEHGQADTAWLVGEALTNLYVGLSRLCRGEKLAADRAIQVRAVDAVLRLAAQVETERPVARDPFAEERRFESRYPRLAVELPSFVQGLERSRESALAILGFLERSFPVNAAIAAEVRALAKEPSKAR